MSPTQAIHLPSPRQILNENYEQASSTNSLTYHNNGSGTSTIFTNTNNNHSTTQNSQYIVPKPALNRPHSPSPLSMESPMSESKYSFPNSTSTRDPKSMSFKPSSADQNMSSPSSEPFSTRSLAPLEPQHSAIPSYLTAQRRGSITDPSLHLSVPNPELARQYSQPDVNFPSTSSSGTISSERRGSFVTDQYPPSPPSHSSSVKSDHSFTPLETRKLRDSLPSISAGASPIRDGFPGPLINPAFQAQLQTRRHSIAVGEVAASLKQKGNIPAPNHPMASDDYPVKRRESVGDPNIQRLSLYDRRSSYSAPSSPPAPPSSSLVPSAKLNVQDVENSLQAHTESGTAPPYSDNGSDHQGTGSISTSHLSDQNDHAPVYPPFNNLRLSQIVQEEVSAPILARRASMPVMTFPSRYSDPAQQDGAVPMDVDRYRTQVYQNHHHTYHPYAYDYPNYIQPQTPVKETPYSRSPELRISHKLAERKRRKEMKELFDELRDSLPVDKSLKTSKWEILSKAVEFINNLKHNQDEMTKEVESLRQQLAAFKGCGNSSDISTAPTSS